MDTGSMDLEGAYVRYSFLRDVNGEWLQFHYTIVPQQAEQIEHQLRTVELAEEQLLRHFEIAPETAILKRFFSSDLINHRQHLLDFKAAKDDDFYFAMTEQPPVSNVKLALMGMCLSNITRKSRNANIFLCSTTSGIRHIFAERLTDPDPNGDSAKQTEGILELLAEKLRPYGATIEGNVLRTWLYAPHVDADYAGIVKARKELFDSINLTPETHYIASTGIQGGTGEPFARVSMDAYAATGLDTSKVRYIQAEEHLSPTHVYGVTFERATAIAMGDTELLVISGTAAIDNKGEIVHPGDVVGQTRRTLTNISALLHAAGFDEQDLSAFIIYLRDPADQGFVLPLIDAYAPDLPAVCVRAPVCRPGWLIEIEATAGRCRP